MLRTFSVCRSRCWIRSISYHNELVRCRRRRGFTSSSSPDIHPNSETSTATSTVESSASGASSSIHRTTFDGDAPQIPIPATEAPAAAAAITSNGRTAEISRIEAELYRARGRSWSRGGGVGRGRGGFGRGRGDFGRPREGVGRGRGGVGRGRGGRGSPAWPDTFRQTNAMPAQPQSQLNQPYYSVQERAAKSAWDLFSRITDRASHSSGKSSSSSVPSEEKSQNDSDVFHRIFVLCFGAVEPSQQNFAQWTKLREIKAASEASTRSSSSNAPSSDRLDAKWPNISVSSSGNDPSPASSYETGPPSLSSSPSVVSTPSVDDSSSSNDAHASSSSLPSTSSPSETQKPTPWADRAFSVLEDMKSAGLKLNAFHFSQQTMAFTRSKQPEKAVELYDRIDEFEITPDIRIYGALLNACAQTADCVAADKIYARILEKKLEVNSIIANNLLQTYANSGDIDRAFEYFGTFEELCIQPNSYIISSLLKACTVAKDSKRIDEVLAIMQERKIPQNIHILNRLAEACVSCGRSFDGFEKLFLDVECVSRSDHLLTDAISQISENIRALSIESQTVWDNLYRAHLKPEGVEVIIKLVQMLSSVGWKLTTQRIVEILDTFCNQFTERALSFFLRVAEQLCASPVSVEVYNRVMQIHLDHFRDGEVHQIYRLMIRHQCSPTIESVNIALNACRAQGDVFQRETVFNEISRYYLTANVETYAALLEVSERAIEKGNIDEVDNADLFFVNMTLMGVMPNERIYRTIIQIHANHNDYPAAMEKLEDYHKMTVPDQRTIGLYDTVLGFLVGGMNPKKAKDAMTIFEMCRDANFSLERPTVNLILQCLSSAKEVQQSVIKLSVKHGLSLEISEQCDSINVGDYLAMKALVRASIQYAFALWLKSDRTSVFTLHGLTGSQYEELSISGRFQCVETSNGSLILSEPSESAKLMEN